jgi:hypothetical protein
VSGNLGLIALFAGVVLVFGGIVAANQAGLFDDGGAAGSGEIKSCGETFIGSNVHEHADLEVYLDSNQPYDFSPQRYQLADNRLHFEHGSGDANGAKIHVHEARPTLGCLFETLNWRVAHDEAGEPVRIETDQGQVYEANGATLEVLVDGEPADRGFNHPIQQDETIVIRYSPADEADDGTSNDTASNGS